MSASPGETWLGHPKGMFLVAFTEFWERFSYFGLAALLALYLTADVAGGGWGWNQADAVLFFGFYGGLIYVVPVAGAWVANNCWGERRSIVTGAVLILGGHLLLGGTSFAPELVTAFTGLDGRAVVERSGVALGRLWALDEVAPALRAAATALCATPGAEALYRTALRTYVAVGGSFLCGLVCIVAGTGLFKSTVASLLGKLYPEGDPRRDIGYTVLFTCIYLGVILANIVAGGLGEAYGWHYGFWSAAAGMALALGAYFWKAGQFLGEAGVRPDRRQPGAGGETMVALTSPERDRVRVLVVQGLFTIVYASAFYQKSGLLTLYVRSHVDRTLLGGYVPTTWFLSVSPATFMLAAPLLSIACLRLARSNRNPSAAYKLAAGLVLLGIAYVLIGVAEALRVESGAAAVSATWIVGMFVIFGITDALVWPNQLALATKLAPRRYGTLAVGAWHLTIGLGIWTTGLIGALSAQLAMSTVFAGLAMLCLVAGAAAALLTPRLQRLMHGAESTTPARAPDAAPLPMAASPRPA